MRSLTMGLGILAAVAVAAGDVQAASTQQQSTVNKPFGQMFVFVTPVTQVRPAVAAKKMVRYDAVLVAVFPDSVIIERQVDPRVIKSWLQSGSVTIGASGYASITTMAVTEDRVLERIYFTSSTVDTVETIKAYLYAPVVADVMSPSTGKRVLRRIKPRP